MKGTNWNSAIGKYTRIVKAETQEKANKANLLKEYNVPIKDIAYILNLSKSRIREYLKEL